MTLNNGTILTHEFSGRIGNHCLQIYKTFLFALKQNIPFNHIKLDKQEYSPLFENIKVNFVDKSILDKLEFPIKFSNHGNLDDIKFVGSRNVMFQLYAWIYPNSPKEFKLFNYLFDAPTLHREILEQYDWLYHQQTIGFTVRRGDFLNPGNDIFRVLPEEELVEKIRWLIDNTLHRAKIVLTSDDIPWCKGKLKEFEENICFIEDTPERQIMALSLCDHVVNNGAVYRSLDYVNGNKFESTFGQIAQLLCVSRHFLSPRPPIPMELWNLKW